MVGETVVVPGTLAESPTGTPSSARRTGKLPSLEPVDDAFDVVSDRSDSPAAVDKVCVAVLAP